MARFARSRDDRGLAPTEGYWPVTRARIAAAKQATRAAVVAVAADTQERMREEAPWYPVGPGSRWYESTGAARASLSATVESQGLSGGHQRWRIVLSYDDAVLQRLNPEQYERVGNYGAHLETMRAGRYAVLQPAAIALRQELGRQLERVWRGIES